MAATQIIIRVDPILKNKLSQLAKSEGKNLSELVRELIEEYTKEIDMGAYIDNLWDKIGQNFIQKNISEKNLEEAIKQVRSKNA